MSMRGIKVSDLTIWQSAIVQAESKFKERNILNLVNYKQESSFASQMIKKNEYLQGISVKRPDTLIDSIINIASIGLSLNPATQYAYLVPRDGICCLDISYKGLIKIATDSGSIMWARADLVYKNDTFTYNGPANKPDHNADVFSDRGEFVGIYCIAKTNEGDYLTETMTAKEIFDIREKSMAYSRSEKGPWADFFGEMAKKSVIKRASKTWPKSDKNDRLHEAIKIVNDHEGIDFEGLSILGMKITEMVNMENINKVNIETCYADALGVVDNDDMDTGPEIAREIKQRLNDDELIVFEKILSNKKFGRKTYKTLFNEYANTYSELTE